MTTNQNFFIITTKGYEIHLAHYNPLDKYNTDKEKKADGVYVSKIQTLLICLVKEKYGELKFLLE